MIKFLMENQQYLERIGLLVIVIAFLVAANIGGRLYYNIGKKKEKFSVKRFIIGIIKAFIVACIVVALTIAYLAFGYLKIITSEMIDPLIICHAAAIYYFGLVTNTLITIFDVKINNTSKPAEIITTSQTLSGDKKEGEKQRPSIDKEIIQNLLDELNEVIK